MDGQGHFNQFIILILIIISVSSKANEVEALLQTLPETEATSICFILTIGSLNLLILISGQCRLLTAIVVIAQLRHLFFLFLLLFPLVVELAFVDSAPLLVDPLLLPAELEPLWLCANPAFERMILLNLGRHTTILSIFVLIQLGRVAPASNEALSHGGIMTLRYVATAVLKHVRMLAISNWGRLCLSLTTIACLRYFGSHLSLFSVTDVPKSDSLFC